MKKKTIVIIVSVLSILLISFALLITIFLVNPYFKYIDTHTWATVMVSGEIQSDEEGVFELTQEYLKGDTIIVGEVTLEITDIAHNGVVDMKLQSGEMYDSNGNKVKKFSISLDKQGNFTMNNGTVTFQVISNRYQ